MNAKRLFNWILWGDAQGEKRDDQEFEVHPPTAHITHDIKHNHYDRKDTRGNQTES